MASFYFSDNHAHCNPKLIKFIKLLDSRCIKVLVMSQGEGLYTFCHLPAVSKSDYGCPEE